MTAARLVVEQDWLWMRGEGWAIEGGRGLLPRKQVQLQSWSEGGMADCADGIAEQGGGRGAGGEAAGAAAGRHRRSHEKSGDARERRRQRQRTAWQAEETIFLTDKRQGGRREEG